MAFVLDGYSCSSGKGAEHLSKWVRGRSRQIMTKKLTICGFASDRLNVNMLRYDRYLRTQ